jgi:GNAT superfamily N-acetyltransferase
MLDPTQGPDAMNLRAALERLVEAELTLAHFNALRTTTAPDGAPISGGETPQFHFLLDATRPTSSYYNRAVARGADAIAEPALAELPAGIVAIETQPAALTPESARLLLSRGFAPEYQLCYLACAPRAGLRAPGVERLGPAQVDELFDLLQRQGVEFPPQRRAAKRQHYCTAQFQAFVARGDDGEARGWTTMFVGEGYAFFGNAYTLPEFRRSGVHSALLAARLAAAAELGATVAYADVEHQSQSHLNCERAGFRTLSINTIWTRGAS